MEEMIKAGSKKLSFPGNVKEPKITGNFYLKDKSSLKKIMQHLIHPEYILFDWEFYSNELEFE